MIKNLKKFRTNKGVTQGQLADAVGVSQQSINKYENHNIEPDIATLIAIADYFNISVDELIGHYCSSNKNSSIEFKLSSEELHIISQYRFLDQKQKDSIKLILENYNK